MLYIINIIIIPNKAYVLTYLLAADNYDIVEPILILRGIDGKDGQWRLNKTSVTNTSN